MAFQKDPCGVICFIVTYMCVIYSDYCLIAHVLIPALSSSIWGAVHVVVFNFLLFLLAYSHLKATLSDPGRVPLPKIQLDFSDARRSSKKRKPVSADEWSLCDRCEAYRPPRAHHCRVCRRCIKKMDHHCPWINNCVGENNQKYFILFLLYTGLSASYALGLTISSWTVKSCEGCSHHYLHDVRFVHLVLLVGICGLFCLFVVCIMYDQLYASVYDMTAIEQASNKSLFKGKAQVCLLRGIFGRGPYWSWLMPCVDPKLETDSVSYTV